MKTANRENPNRWAKVSSNRAHAAADQNRSCSIKWAAKVEKFRPRDKCFFLTFPFIEQIRKLTISDAFQVRFADCFQHDGNRDAIENTDGIFDKSSINKPEHGPLDGLERLGANVKKSKLYPAR